jgi:hypothetical protein
MGRSIDADDSITAIVNHSMTTRTTLLSILLFLLAACSGLSAAPPPATPTLQPLAYEHKLPFGIILALVEPETVAADGAAGHISPNDMVMGLEINGERRAYPIGLMRRYEVANYTLGGEPIAVTFCPSCNTGLAFSRVVAGQELLFDFSGMTLDEAMVMRDRSTGTLWSQVRLQAVEGSMAGQRLELLASNQMTWQEWAAGNPDTTLVVDPRAPARAGEFGLPALPTKPSVDPDAYRGYVAGIAFEGEATAFPLEEVRRLGVVNSEVAGQPLMLVGLDEPGEVTVWERTVDGRSLTFAMRDGQLVDDETGSAWNPESGAAVSGPLAGSQLARADVWISDWRGWLDVYPHTSLELLG